MVKIYKVPNKGRDSFTVSYHANGTRHLQMFAHFAEAHAEATAKARSMANGELDVLQLRSTDRNAYILSRNLALLQRWGSVPCEQKPDGRPEKTNRTSSQED